MDKDRAVHPLKPVSEKPQPPLAAVEFEEASWRFAILGAAAITPLREALEALGAQDSLLKASVLSSLARRTLSTGRPTMRFASAHQPLLWRAALGTMSRS